MNTLETSTYLTEYEEKRRANQNYNESEGFEDWLSGIVGEGSVEQQVNQTVQEVAPEVAPPAQEGTVDLEAIGNMLDPTSQIQQEIPEESVVADAIEEERQQAWYDPILKGVEFLTSPLLAAGDFAMAPIANPSDADNLADQFLENFATASNAAKKRLFPTWGDEHELYGADAARNLLPEGTPESVIQNVGTVADIIVDPGFVLTAGTAKTVQRGLQLARQQRVAQGTQAPTSGLIQDGLHDILGVGYLGDRGATKSAKEIRQNVKDVKGTNPKELGKIGSLAQEADGFKTLADGSVVKVSKDRQREALKELNVELNKNPVIKAAVKAADDADVEKALQKYDIDFGSANKNPFEIKTVDLKGPQAHAAALKNTLNTNEKYAGVNLNLSKNTSIEEVEFTLEAVGNAYIKDFRKAAGTQANSVTMAKAQNVQLSELLGTKTNEFKPEQAYALRQMLLSSGENLQARAAASLADGASPAAHAAFEQSLEIHRYLQAKATGVAAHAGRILQSHAIEATSTRARLKAIENMVDSSTAPREMEMIKRQLASLDDSTAINRLVAKDKPTNKYGNAAFELYANSILSGPITHAVNIASNTLNLAWAPTEKFLEGMSAGARLDFQKSAADMAEALAMTTGIAEGVADAFRLTQRKIGSAVSRSTGMESAAQWGKSWEDLNLRRVGKGHHELAQQRAMHSISSESLGMQGPLGAFIDIAGNVIRLPGEALLAEDKVFKTINQRMHINAQAARRAAAAGGSAAEKRQIFNVMKNNPNEHMIQNAVDMQEYFTFTNKLGNIADPIGRALKHSALGRFIVPFFNTPTNIVKMGVRNSVVGNVFKDLKPALTKGGAEGDVARAKIAMGTMAPMALMAMWPEDRITGSIDESTPAGRFAAKQGKPPYSIKIGDKWISYEKMEPMRAILGFVASVREGWNNLEPFDEYGEPNPTYEEAGAVLIGSFTRMVSESYMLDAIGGAMAIVRGANVGNPEYFWKEFKRVTTNMVSPNALRQWNQVYGDGTIRQAETWLEMWKKGIPNLSNELPPKRNVWGEEQLHPEGLGPDIISPLKSMERDPDYVDKEIMRLGVSVPEQVKEITVDGIPIELNIQQRDTLAILRGQGFEGGPTLKQTFEEMFSDPMYQMASDMDKAAEVKKRFTQATENAKQYMIATDWELQTAIDEAVEAREIHRQRTMQ